MRAKLLLVFLVIILAGNRTALAGYPDCGPYQLPSSACRPAFVNNMTVIVAPGRPFAWLRASPSSFAWPVYTAPVGMLLLIQKPGPEPMGGHWDGYQWWF